MGAFRGVVVIGVGVVVVFVGVCIMEREIYRVGGMMRIGLSVVMVVC